jgi:TRAP-type C4-dicarboxylate transport system permease small subunit
MKSPMKNPRGLPASGLGAEKMGALKRAAHFALVRLPEVAVGIFTLAIAFVVIIQVFLRYVLQQDWRGSDEYVRILLLWVIFLGAAIATKRVAHLGVNILARRLPPRVVRFLDIAIYLIICGVAAVMIYQGAIIADRGFTNTFTMSGVPVGYQYIALPISGILILLYALYNLITGKPPVPENGADTEKLEEDQ